MKVLKQFDSLVIEQFEVIEYPHAYHQHNHYELIYIDFGKGRHIQNDHKVPYSGGDLFVVAPGDSHFFEIDQLSHFVLIRFTESYFENYRHLMPDSFKAFTPVEIMQQNVFKENKLELSEPLKKILDNVVNSIIIYNDQAPDDLRSPTMFYLLLAIFGLLWEVARKDRGAKGNYNVVKEELINYIHQHVYHRNQLYIPAIAARFGIAPNYFSTYFKKRFGVPYNDYLITYRNKLIEQRINAGNMSLSNIAREFGFTDESHFTKYIKKHYGKTPKEMNRSL